MRCDEIGKLLLPYIEGELLPDAASKIAEHLEKCSTCRSNYVNILGAKKIIRAHKDWREIRPSPELSDSVLRRVRIERSRVGVRAPTRKRHNYLIYLATVAAVLLIIAIVGIAFLGGREDRKPKDMDVVQKEKPREELPPSELERLEKLEEITHLEEHTQVKRAPEDVEKPHEEKFQPKGKPESPAVKTLGPAEQPKPPEKVEEPRPPTETPKTVVKLPVAIAAIDKVIKKPEVKRKDKEKWETVKEGESLFSGDMLKTGTREKITIVLSDNSTVILNSSTEVTVEKKENLWAVRLEKGEIFVQAVARKEKSRFEVRTPSATITVKGTEFNISHKSRKTTLTVIEGEVECSNDSGSIKVKKGYEARVNVNKKPSSPRKLSPERLAKLTGWTKPLLPIPEPIADAKLPTGFGYYEGCGEATWGRTNVTSHSGRYSAFLKGAEYEDNFLNVALVIGDSDGYKGPNAYDCNPNIKYSFSFWVKGSFKKIEVVATQWKTDAAPLNDRVQQKIADFVPTPRWTRIKGTFTTRKQARKFVLLVKAYGVYEELNLGVLYVDDVVIKKEGSDRNIVENPGIEKGN
jgi:hypothetical protein